MKIAILADVHGNLPALEAVIVHARSQGVSEFWNLGDMVGYGPSPDECVRVLEKTCAHSIYGNHDKKSISRQTILEIQKSKKDPNKVFSFTWTHEHLSREARAYIKALPDSEIVTLDDKKILLSHGSPAGTSDELTPETEDAKFSALAKDVLTQGVSLVLSGHTHRFFDRQADGVRFVNPGAVSRSFDGDCRASYVILEMIDGAISIQHFRIEYDIDHLALQMKLAEFPERIIRSVLDARSLRDMERLPMLAPAEILDRVFELAVECRYEKEHALKVTALALKIFDGTAELHKLSASERLLLQSGAILHDIGFIENAGDHHKAGRDLIMRAEKLPLRERERKIVALIVRYHRKGSPERHHKLYSSLSREDQRVVDGLAGILRVADGLDRSHRSLVEDVKVKVTSRSVTLTLRSKSPVAEEVRYALIKSDLFTQAFSRNLIVH